MSLPVDDRRLLLGTDQSNTYGTSGGGEPISFNPEILARMIQMRANQITMSPSPYPSQDEQTGNQPLRTGHTIPLKGAGDIPDGQYVGEMKGNQPHGHGMATYKRHPERKNWKHYQGEWQNGKFHGKGILTLRNGSRFDGNWEEGQLHGHAVVFFSDQFQTRYKCDYVRGQKEGKGKMIKANGEQYEGDWEKGKFHGQGLFTNKFGDIYEGEFKEGYLNGEGKKLCVSGDVCEGFFKNGLLHGQGKMHKGNTLMTGEWREGKLWTGSQGAQSVVNGKIVTKTGKTRG